MGSPNRQSNMLRVSLQENGVHSLTKAVKAYDTYTRTGNAMLLKDMIMDLHHGVELMMKQILVKRDPMLIVSNLDEVARKRVQSSYPSSLDLFSDDNVRTITYDIALLRVRAIIQPPSLDSELVEKLEELNSLRNRIEHFAIDVDIKVVERLLSDLFGPLQTLFESQLGRINELRTASITHALNTAESAATDSARRMSEVHRLLGQFNGQTVPGVLFSSDNDITLPHFDSYKTGYIGPKSGVEVDILAEGVEASWAIHVQGRILSRKVDPKKLLDDMSRISHELKCITWLIDFEGGQKLRSLALDRKMRLTGPEDWEKLNIMINDVNRTNLRDEFEVVLSSYLKARTGQVSRKAITLAFKAMAETLQQSNLVRTRDTLVVEYGLGLGNLPLIPWIAVRDSRVSRNIRTGVYCVYLFKADLSAICLTINQGVGRGLANPPTRVVRSHLQAQAIALRPNFDQLSALGFVLESNLDLRDRGGTARSYAAATIAYKCYEQGQVPQDEELLRDLETALDSYEAYIDGRSTQ